VHLVPFTVTIPEGDVDPDLRAKLERELPGILKWAVDGAIAWRDAGLRPPPAVRAAVEEYRGSEDVLGHFIDECCVQQPSARGAMNALHAAYVTWAQANGERTMSLREMRNALIERPGITAYRSKSNRGLAGIRLLSSTGTGDASDALPLSLDNSTHTRAREEKLSEMTSQASPASLELEEAADA
jgi:putative DNA primase/helicase